MDQVTTAKRTRATAKNAVLSGAAVVKKERTKRSASKNDIMAVDQQPAKDEPDVKKNEPDVKKEDVVVVNDEAVQGVAPVEATSDSSSAEEGKRSRTKFTLVTPVFGNKATSNDKFQAARKLASDAYRRFYRTQGVKEFDIVIRKEHSREKRKRLRTISEETMRLRTYTAYHVRIIEEPSGKEFVKNGKRIQTEFKPHIESLRKTERANELIDAALVYLQGIKKNAVLDTTDTADDGTTSADDQPATNEEAQAPGVKTVEA
jgi:hypothetical protein